MLFQYFEFKSYSTTSRDLATKARPSTTTTTTPATSTGTSILSDLNPGMPSIRSVFRGGTITIPIDSKDSITYITIPNNVNYSIHKIVKGIKQSTTTYSGDQQVGTVHPKHGGSNDAGTKTDGNMSIDSNSKQDNDASDTDCEGGGYYNELGYVKDLKSFMQIQSSMHTDMETLPGYPDDIQDKFIRLPEEIQFKLYNGTLKVYEVFDKHSGDVIIG